MRIASISDIHANYPALLAVLEDIRSLGDDVHLIVAGNILNVGPYPKQTLDLIRSLKNATIIRGNHEHYLLSAWKKLPTDLPPSIILPDEWTVQQLTTEDMEWLDHLPDRAELAGPDDTDIVVLHASPLSNRKGIFQQMSDEDIAGRFADEVPRPRRLYVFGHVHRPLWRQWQGVTLAGDGSVGQPLDHDTRACYLLAEWDERTKTWRAEHRRVAYDRTEYLAAMHALSDYDRCGPFMKLITHNVEQGYGANLDLFFKTYLPSDWQTAADPLAHLEGYINQHIADFMAGGSVEQFVIHR